jgi:hypothetical protein
MYHNHDTHKIKLETSRILGSHSGGYEDLYLLGYNFG